MKFQYQAEKLSVARRALMLPHSRGEAHSIAEAFQACDLGFKDLRTDALDESPRRWVGRIQGLMDTTGIEDPQHHGTWLVKAQRLTTDQKLEMSRAVDELASWFDAQFWGGASM